MPLKLLRGLEGKKVGWQMGAGNIKSARTAPHLLGVQQGPRGPGAALRVDWGLLPALQMLRVGLSRAHAARERGGAAREQGAEGARAKEGGPLYLTWPAAPFSHLQRHLKKFLCLSLSNDVLIRGRRDEIITEVIFIFCLEIRISVAHLISIEAITLPKRVELILGGGRRGGGRRGGGGGKNLRYYHR